MKIKGKDLKFKQAGIGLLMSPMLGGMIQKYEFLLLEEIILILIACVFIFFINLTSKFFRILWIEHKNFKSRYLLSQLIILVYSIFIPIQYVFIILIPLYVYIGDLAIKSLEEL